MGHCRTRSGFHFTFPHVSQCFPVFPWLKHVETCPSSEERTLSLSSLASEPSASSPGQSPSSVKTIRDPSAGGRKMNNAKHQVAFPQAITSIVTANHGHYLHHPSSYITAHRLCMDYAYAMDHPAYHPVYQVPRSAFVPWLCHCSELAMPGFNE